MAKLSAIKRFLDKELDIKKIPDSSRNGLQTSGKKEIKKIGFAVDGVLSTFEKAKKAKVDLLIVHHGVKWKPQKRKELTKKRMDFLIKNKIALYGVHLPLDAHHKYGNNIQLAQILDLKNIKKFGRYNGHTLGYKGIFKKATSIRKMVSVLNKKLETKSQVLNFGKKNIKSIAIVSGGAGSMVENSVKEKCDCFLTGEISLGDYNTAKDYKTNMIASGHYATETGGVKALMPVLKEKFNIQTIFIDNKTGV